ncbi:MAG: Fur family transcriptional regulator [Terricaulis sp.]
MMTAQEDRANKLGPVARIVFALLAEAPAPLTAYELLWRLQARRGKSAPPSSVYRALKTLIDAGLAHRVASLNAFVVCREPERPHHPMFLICESCGATSETDIAALGAPLRDRAEHAGFRVSKLHFDVRGVCAACRSAKAD